MLVENKIDMSVISHLEPGGLGGPEGSGSANGGKRVEENEQNARNRAREVMFIEGLVPQGPPFFRLVRYARY
jgi:hypothetical protein